MRSGDVNSPPSLSHKQTELCICGNVVLYKNSAIISPKWCFDVHGGHAIQMSDILKECRDTDLSHLQSQKGIWRNVNAG